MNRIDSIREAIRDIPDFPKKGIIFKDISPILKNRTLFAEVIDVLTETVNGSQVDYIAGIESRGFIFGSALALKMNAGFVPIRKPGKLPYKTFREAYQLEYGTDALEIHQDAIETGSTVLLVDDLLATGGTARAAAKLIEHCGGNVRDIIFLVELGFLNGIQQLKGYSVRSIITF